MAQTKQEFQYSKWRHGGWYVHNVRYPSGAIGCVSRNYSDGKWRVVSETGRIPFAECTTYKCRDDAAQAEADMIARAALAKARGEA